MSFLEMLCYIKKIMKKNHNFDNVIIRVYYSSDALVKTLLPLPPSEILGTPLSSVGGEDLR